MTAGTQHTRQDVYVSVPYVVHSSPPSPPPPIKQLFGTVLQGECFPPSSTVSGGGNTFISRGSRASFPPDAHYDLYEHSYHRFTFPIQTARIFLQSPNVLSHQWSFDTPYSHMLRNQPRKYPRSCLPYYRTPRIAYLHIFSDLHPFTMRLEEKVLFFFINTVSGGALYNLSSRSGRVLS